MKKLLALVLALVMTLGLATVAANAELKFPDAGDVEFTEAVEVLSGVKVFKGDEKGNFQPKANLDRASAAKLIAYLDLGEKTAEALPAVQAFNDVPASHWASKYIAYCANSGYLAGDGNGNFLPTQPLTGYAFGKMVLCVLGYDAKIEGFTGSSWSINVAKLMQSNDITKGIDGNASATLTREQAAQYCLNALKATCVEYEDKGTTITASDITINTGAKKAKDMTVKASTTKNTWAAAIDGTLALAEADLTVQLGEKRYDGDLKLDKTALADSFNAPASQWKYKAETLGTYAKAPDATYTGKVTQGTIYTLLGKSLFDDLGHQNATPAYDRAELVAYLDGVATAAWSQDLQISKGSSAAAYGSDKGTLTEVYIEDGKSTIDGPTDSYAKVTVITKNLYVAKATADYNSSTDKVTLDAPSHALNSLKGEDFGVLKTLKEDDYILYTYAGGEVKTVEKAQTLTGKVSTFTNGKDVTIDGTKFSFDKSIKAITVANTAAGHDANVAFAIGDTATIVLDGQDGIIYVDEAKASSDDIVYIVDTVANGFDFQSKLITIDGKKLTVTLDSDSKNNAGAKIAAGNVGTFKGIFAYTIEDGKYELSAYARKADQAADAANKVAMNKVTDLVATKTANSSTVYVVKNADGDVSVYTGVKNAPDVTFAPAYADKNAHAAFNTKNELTYVFVEAGAGGVIDDASAAADELIYVLNVNNNDLFTDANKDKYYEMKVLENGTEKTVKITESARTAGTFVAGTLYKSVKTNSKGFITGATAITTNVGDKYTSLALTEVLAPAAGATTEAYKYSDGTMTAKADAGAVSGFIKTDKVYLVLLKNVGNNKLMNDENADFEIAEVTNFNQLSKFVKGYTVGATGYLAWSEKNNDTDKEVIGAYITITSSHEA